MTVRGLIAVWIAAAIGIAATVSLGNWQTRRGDQKLALQARADRAEHAAPLVIGPSLSSIEAVAAQLPCRVRLTGVFDPAGTVYLDNRTLDGVAGLYVITPLAIGEGLPAVLIDRGWMARDMRDRQRVAAPPPPVGRVTVEGIAVARPSMLFELGDTGVRPVPGLWHNLNYAAYEQATGRSVAHFVVRHHGDSRTSDGLRRQWAQPAAGVEKHRGYAFQWYLMAALIAAFATWSSWKSWPPR